MSVNDPMMESKHHLPECTLPKGHGDCICGELRAAEQRVTSDFAKYLRHMVDDDKFAAGVKAARDVVAAAMAKRGGYHSASEFSAVVLAAIDGVQP